MHRRDGVLEAFTTTIRLGNLNARGKMCSQALLDSIHVRGRVGHDIYPVYSANSIKGRLRRMNVHQRNVASEHHAGSGGSKEAAHDEILATTRCVNRNAVAVLESITIGEGS